MRINVSFFKSIGLLAIAGCALEAPSADAVGDAALTATSITFLANSGIGNEHCRVHTSRAADWPAGRQLLIYRGATLRGACTVDGGGTVGADTIEMSRPMMKDRVWLDTDGMDAGNPGQIVATISGVTVRNETPSAPAAPRITAAVSTLAELEVNGDNTMREYTTTPTGTTGILVGYTAPHPTENPAPSGGLGRSYQGWKAAQGKLDAAHDAFWTPGWRGNRGHCIDDPEGSGTICDTKRFHITSTEISFASYPGLTTLAGVGLDYAVALHGQGAKSAATCNTNIMVGGLVGNDLASDPLGFRRGIAENLRLLVPPETAAGDGQLVPDHVKYSQAGNGLGGCSFDEGTGTANFVNVLALSGGVRRGLQLEQGSALVAATYQAVGEAVHQVFDCLNATADVNVGTVASSFAAQNSSASGYATDGNRCNGFVVDATFSTSSDDFFAGLQTCQVGAKVHLDVYHRNAAGSWDRVAGGTRTYTACSPAVFTDAAYDDDGVAPAPSFQHALTGAASAGEFRLVIHGYSGAYFTPAAALPVFGQAS